MDVIVERPAALDVHKEQVTACVRVADEYGARVSHLADFKTTVRGLLVLRDWLKAHRVTQVTMKATGVYRKPVWHVLEDEFELLLVNARHVKQVPGRKTDVSDAAWLCQLAEAVPLRASFEPPKPIRGLPQLTRYRKRRSASASEANRLHKALENTGIKLDCVATDILGKSGRAMLDALVAGTTDPEVLADLAKGPDASEDTGAARGARRPLRTAARAADRSDPRAPGLPRRTHRPALGRDRGASRPVRAND